MEPVRAVALDVEIHPYVKGRLRLQRRQEETGGVLLGTAEGSSVQITGFKRLAGGTLRQAAEAAGPGLIGFYRVQTPGMTTLQAEEEQLWSQILPHGRSVFLLIQIAEGTGTAAQVWSRQDDAPPRPEKILFLHEDSPPAVPAAAAPVSAQRLRIKFPSSPKWVPGAAAALLTLVASAWCYQEIRPAAPPPSITLDLQSRDAELTATWEQSSVPAEQLQSASLLVSEDGKEKQIDLTRRYSPKGHLVLRPTGRDVILTLNVKYRGTPPISNTAIYVGFRSRRPAPAAPRPVPVDAGKNRPS